MVWNAYADERFKKTSRVSRGTFQYIVGKRYGSLKKATITEELISSECRVAISLYRLRRGDYLYPIAELAGIGETTTFDILFEVCHIVEVLWRESVSKLWPDSEEKILDLMRCMDAEWQFTFAYAAIDGSHISIRCPPGGAEAAKEYCEFKNFYSVILMAVVGVKYRFIWGSCRYPGNSHDSMTFQSTELYSSLTSDRFQTMVELEGSVMVPPILFGDGAFPFHPWLMKPFSQATLKTEEK